MRAPDSLRLPRGARRRALRLGYLHGMLWSVGGGLTGGTLIVYLALELGAQGIAVSWVLATPAAVGLLRLLSPVLIGLCGDARRTCLWFWLASYLALALLPAVVLVPSAARGIVGLVLLLCLHQLLEYLGLVAFWSWMADLVPRRIRGRYFGRRQVLGLAVLLPVLLASGLLADGWKRRVKDERPELVPLGYAMPAGFGTGCLLVSLLPLVHMPLGRHSRLPERGKPENPGTRPSGSQDRLARSAWRTIPEPFRDGRFWRLLAFGVWFSLANGVTQAAQNIYPYALGVSATFLLAMQAAMRGGQLGVAAWAGPFSDRYGNRPVLVLCQAILATGPLFYLLATPSRTWPIAGAWIAWSAYAGLNVCLPNLMLKLSPTRNNASYIACYFAVTNLVYAASTVAGGYLTDYLKAAAPVLWLGGWQMNHFQYLLAAGWVQRSLAVVLLLWLIEPGAWTWRQIVKKLAAAEKPGFLEKPGF
jgi:MFS family permease